MEALKANFEAGKRGIQVVLTPGRSKELAERILRGEACDVFAPSDPQVVKDLFDKAVDGKAAASWYIAFSANELVIVTEKGNPYEIKKASDLVRKGIRLARVAGEKDMATDRTMEFLDRATKAEGKPELLQPIVESALKENTIPHVLAALRKGKANAAIVYRSAAVTLGNDAEIVTFPAEVNLSGKIRNVVTIPGTAGNVAAASEFIKGMLSLEGRRILETAGQPPLVPPIPEGELPFEIPARP
jgi:molybdenum ABC transporter molybdate-binding protein